MKCCEKPQYMNTLEQLWGDGGYCPLHLHGNLCGLPYHPEAAIDWLAVEDGVQFKLCPLVCSFTLGESWNLLCCFIPIK